MLRMMRAGCRGQRWEQNLPVFNHDVQDADLIHVEDDVEQVADNKDEDNQ